MIFLSSFVPSSTSKKKPFLTKILTKFPVSLLKILRKSNVSFRNTKIKRLKYKNLSISPIPIFLESSREKKNNILKQHRFAFNFSNSTYPIFLESSRHPRFRGEGERKKREIRLIKRTEWTVAIEERGGGRGGWGGIDDSGGCSKVSRKGKWSRIGRFRSISRARFVRWLVLPPSFERGPRYRVSPMTADNRALETSTRQNQYRPFFVPHRHPFFAECSKSSGEETKSKKTNEREHDLI